VAPENEPGADDMNRLKEEAMNRITIGERQRPTLRKMDTEDIDTVERDGTEYDDDTQKRGRDGRGVNITIPRTNRYRLYRHLSPSGQKNKVEKPGGKLQERRRSRTRAYLPKSQLLR